MVIIDLPKKYMIFKGKIKIGSGTTTQKREGKKMD